MKNKWMRLGSVMLAATMLCTVASGCARETSKKVIEPMEKEEVYALGFHASGGSDVMPISGFSGPKPNTYSVDGASQPEMITDEYFKAYADAGINCITFNVTDYQGMDKEVMKMLNLGEKYGISVFVTDSMIMNQRGEEVWDTVKLGQRMSEYLSHPAFAGVYVIDEPWYPGVSQGSTSRLIDEVAPLYQKLSEMGLVAYNNLNPNWIAETREDYLKYVDHFLDTCDVPYIMYDHYVFDEGRTKEEYFDNLSIIRSAAEKYKIPFWTFVQAGTSWNDAQERFDTEEYLPKETEFDWNINTCLAYGAKGIGYFPMIQPMHFAYAKSTEWDFERNGIIGAWGNKTRWYYYAQDISAHIQAIDEVLMNSVNKGVVVSGEKAIKDNAKSECILEGTSWRELTGVSGDAMIGCFNYQGKTALYVVNYDTEYAQDIQLKFYDECKFSVVQDAEKRYYQGKEIKLPMQAGEGVLIVFE